MTIGSFFRPGHAKTAESVISVEYGGVPEFLADRLPIEVADACHKRHRLARARGVHAPVSIGRRIHGSRGWIPYTTMEVLMNAPSAETIEEFAKEFAQKGTGRGLTEKEILAFFRRYANNVIDPDIYGPALTKRQVFRHCLERLHVEDQYRALIDLGLMPPDSDNPLPDEATRTRLVGCCRPARIPPA